ncbi:MAG: endonuclease/exonuclease/phosphatase family protein [Clostridia bacterium]|nr:endonuclease/exonuclease/phosphatase family protein [Clostridia bacterium]
MSKSISRPVFSRSACRSRLRGIRFNSVLQNSRRSDAFGRNESEQLVSFDREYTISTYNIGFGAYDQQFTFFMDVGFMADGTEVTGEHSRAQSKDTVLFDTNGAVDTIAAFAPDFALFQEVDTDSHRSFFVNQYDLIKGGMSDYTTAFAVNFHSAYLAYPFGEPHGTVNSGIATMSKFKIESAVRKSFTVTDNIIDKLFDLDRCFSVSYLPIESSDKYLVIINVHMSAYDEGGVIRTQQMKELRDFMDSEVLKGNYVIAGGDFNHDLLTNNPDYSYTGENKPFADNITQLTPEWLSFMYDEGGASPFGVGFKVVASDNSPTCRDADISWQPGITYVSTIDGFIVSSNIEVISHENLITSTDNLEGFAYSDHEPATMTFKLIK